GRACRPPRTPRYGRADRPARRLLNGSRSPGPPHRLLTHTHRPSQGWTLPRCHRLLRQRARTRGQAAAIPITSGSSAGSGPAAASAEGWPKFSLPAAAAGVPGTPEKSVGEASVCQRGTGQTMASARPTTADSGTKPRVASFMWYRESAEISRWSPITHSFPAGTVTRKVMAEGAFPGKRYGSSIETPLTVIRPWESQQATVSPGTPITRLMRSRSDGSRPTKVKTFLTVVSTGPSFCGDSAVLSSQWPGSLKTMTSPRP